MSHLGRIGVLAAAVLMVVRGMGAETFVAFGLTNVTLGQATNDTSGWYGPFTFSNLRESGEDGVSIHLGEADSGVFVYPATNMDPPNGSFLRGHLYGSVNGETNRLICSMRAHEEHDGFHPVEIDFAPLGSTQFTFLLFRHGQLVAQTGPHEGTMAVYGNYFEPYYPRVNPFLRLPDGRVGAVIEFASAAPMSLHGVGDVTGDRVIIRAENSTNVVDFASRLDVTGGGRIEYFQIYGAGLGMFNRPHVALDNTLLQARAGKLTLAEDGASNSTPGVVIELNQATRFNATFEPIELSTNGTFTVTATGYGAMSNAALGWVRLRHDGDVMEMSAELGTQLTNVEVIVYLDGVEVERAAGTTASAAATARVAGLEATARTIEGPAGIGLRFEQPVAVTLPNLAVYNADEVQFVVTGFEPFLALQKVALETTRLPAFTIISEVEETFVAPRLNISRSGTQVEISWIDPNQLFMLQYAVCLGCGFNASGLEPSYDGEMARVLVNIATEEVETRVFRLGLFPPPETED